MENKKIRGKNNALILIMLFCIIFLPRKIYVASMYSFRFFSIVFLLLFCIMKKKIKFDTRILGNPLFFAYIIYSFLNYVFTNQILSGCGFVLDSVIMMILFMNVFDSRDKIDFFYKNLTVLIFIYSIICIIESLTGFNIYEKIFNIQTQKFVRFGIFRNVGSAVVTNNNANFLFICCAIITYRIYTINNYLEKKYYIYTLIISSVALILTLSRGTIVIYLLFQVIILFRVGVTKVIKKNLLKILIVTILLFGIYVLIPQTRVIISKFYDMFEAMINKDVAKSISEDFGSNSEGVGQRLNLYDWTIEKLGEDKVFGKGANEVFSYRYQTSYGKYVTKYSLENHFLTILYQFGYVGVILFIINIISVLLYLFNHMNSKKITLNNVFFIVSFFMIILMFLTCLYDELRLYYIIFGIVISENNIRERMEEK